MLRGLLRALAMALVRLYYPRRQLLGAENLPASGPVVLVANHPNGLLDPLVMRLQAGRSVRFLAKSTFWKNPVGRLAMDSFGSIPVYRSQDVTAGEPAGERRMDRNEQSFALCRQALAAGDWLALFPEGTSHSEPQLRPLKTGAARIALSAAAGQGNGAPGPMPVQVVPVGLAYEAKAIFRSAVLVLVGRPLEVASHVAAFRRDERAAVEAFTADIRQALDAVVLQAETSDVLEGVAQVAAWTASDPAAAADPAVRRERARVLLAAYRTMRARDPQRVERIVQAARDYARVLQHLGVRDPWALEVGRVSPGRALLALGKLVITAPFAAVGALLGYLPYRLAGVVGPRVTDETDVLGTVKLMGGALFVGVGWLLEIAAAAWLGGAVPALALAVLAPLGGYAALRFGELHAEFREAARNSWLRKARPGEVAHLTARRRALAREITETLESTPPARG
jgi:glycerol-3-phosphate O-acyltransferase/dihydroxyacetone phosphate acyltransferase